MNFFLKSAIFFLLFSGSISFAKITSRMPFRGEEKSSALSEKTLIEELTGKKSLVPSKVSHFKKGPLPLQHFMAGQQAAAQKNYILAIKHFNTVIQKYPQSGEVIKALVAKAQVYTAMGLKSQAQRNLKLAQLQKKPSRKGIAEMQDKNKIVK